MPVKPIPDGFHAVTPYLTVKGAAKVIEFLKQAFGAELPYEPIRRPDGAIMHAEVRIGDSPVMIADESEYAEATPPRFTCTFQMSTQHISRRSRQAASRSCSRWICSTATAAAV